jgi:hypothetical protein
MVRGAKLPSYDISIAVLDSTDNGGAKVAPLPPVGFTVPNGTPVVMSDSGDSIKNAIVANITGKASTYRVNGVTVAAPWIRYGQHSAYSSFWIGSAGGDSSGGVILLTNAGPVTLGVRNASGAFIDCCDPKVRAEIDATIAKLKPEASKVQDYRNVILEDNPLHYWPLQDVNGTTATALIGTSLTYANSPTLGKAGAFSTGLSAGLVRTSSQRASATGLTGFTQPLTLEIWVKPTSLIGSFQNILVVQPATGSAALGVNVSSANVFRMDAYDGTTVRSISGGAPTVNTWNHIACVFTSNTSRELFINGVSVGTNTQSLTAAAAYTRVGVGVFVQGFADHLNGDVSHAAVYSYAMSAARIQYHYLAGLNGINPVLRGVGV